MRVLAVGNLYPPAAEGGYERTWAAVTAALRDAGHDARVLTTAPVPGRPLPAGHEDPPEVVRALRWYWRDFAFERPRARARLARERHNARVLAEVLAAAPPDVVAWWGMGGMSLSLIEQVRRRGLPAVGVVEDAWMGYGRRADRWTWPARRLPAPAARAVERAAGVPVRVDLSNAAHWTFASEWLRGLAAPLRLARTSVTHLGVDPAAFPPRPAAPWGWRLACVGRVERDKGIATAVQALAQLPAEATLTVRGDGDAAHREELTALAARLGVTERLRFEPAAAGPVLGAYAAADAILFPVTWAEPWGLVPLEAMSVGRPVVATGTGGSAEYLRHGANCLLSPPGDAEALARAVRRLAQDAALRERLVAEGRMTAGRYTEAGFTAAVLVRLADAARRA